MLVLQETWETKDAYQAYAFSPLKTELINLVLRSAAQPPTTWEVEEVRFCGRS